MITIVVGGFYGDEGKGKIVGYLAAHDKPRIVVRAGSGPQAGHTVTPTVKVTQVPSGLVYPKARLLIARGTLISPEIFLKEVKENNLEGRIFIDRGCTIIEQKHIKAEADLVKRIGSVGTGVGPARVDRVLRTAKLAKDEPRLKRFLTNVADEVNTAADKKKNILIEGVQGYGLSLFNEKYYPFVTSQDTTASQFAADTGIGPKLVDHVVVIFKAYVSRVGTDPHYKEWNKSKEEKMGISEHGSVSGRKRRLSDFDCRMAAEAYGMNTGTAAALTCIDRLFPGNENVTDYKKLTKEAKNFIKEQEVKVKK
ncbi:MAG: adenylosuccinate synthetase, partial [Candidatus Levyibacteriota bacterium]